LLEIDEGDYSLQQDNHTSNEKMNFLCDFFDERIIYKGLFSPSPHYIEYLQIPSYGVILKEEFIKIDHKH
jgi:hypothetical protein